MNHTPSERTTVSLPGELARRLSYKARRTGKSTSSVVREALEQYLAHDSADMPSFVGLAASGGADVAKSFRRDLEAHMAARRERKAGGDPAARAPKASRRAPRA